MQDTRIRYKTKQVVINARPWPTYWFCEIDTGKLFVDPRTGRTFYQNFDEDYYAKLNQWCVYEFGRGCRTTYNQFYFRTIEEFNMFKERWL